MSKAFDRIKNGLDDIAAWKAGETTATIHFDGQSYQMTRPEHDAFRLGVAAGRRAGLIEAADALGDLFNTAGHYKSTHSEDDRAALISAMDRAAVVLADPSLAKP